MLLMDVKKEGIWLRSIWKLTSRVEWEKICKAVSSTYDFYNNVEVAVFNQEQNVDTKEDVLNLPESSQLTIRGTLKLFPAMISITFVNQLSDVYVDVLVDNNEFKEADYKKFNISLSTYLDSIEIAMYR